MRAGSWPRWSAAKCRGGRKTAAPDRHAGRRRGTPPTARREESLAPRTAQAHGHRAARPAKCWGSPGLLGSGRTELARLLFALDERDSGEISIDGKPAKLDDPADALRLGLGFCPEDRKHSGIVADLSVRENIALALQARMGLTKFLRCRRTTADRRKTGGRARREDREHRDADRSALRRQPAEGHHRALARHPSACADPRRTHARHRHRRQAGIDAARSSTSRAAAPPCCSSPRRSKKWCVYRIASWCCATAPRPANCRAARRKTRSTR